MAVFVCSFAINDPLIENKRNLSMKQALRFQIVMINKRATIWVNDREDIEIISVDMSLDFSRSAVLSQQTICEVFVDLKTQNQILKAETFVENIPWSQSIPEHERYRAR